MNQESTKAAFGRRVLAFYIDSIILSAILVPVIIPFLYRFGHDTTFPILIFVAFLCLSLKDTLKGAGIGKRLLRIAVRYSANSDLKPPWYMLFLRNILIFIWPIELIVFLVKKRKIGDYLAKTDVYFLDKNKAPDSDNESTFIN